MTDDGSRDLSNRFACRQRSVQLPQMPDGLGDARAPTRPGVWLAKSRRAVPRFHDRPSRRACNSAANCPTRAHCPALVASVRARAKASSTDGEGCNGLSARPGSSVQATWTTPSDRPFGFVGDGGICGDFEGSSTATTSEPAFCNLSESLTFTATVVSSEPDSNLVGDAQKRPRSNAGSFAWAGQPVRNTQATGAGSPGSSIRGCAVFFVTFSSIRTTSVPDAAAPFTRNAISPERTLSKSSPTSA